MIIDVNNQIGKRRSRPEVTAGELLEAMDAAKVEKAIVFCFSTSMDNASVHKAIVQHPDRLIGLYTINPWQEDALQHLEEALSSGYAGMRLDAIRSGFAMNDLDLLGGLLERCAQEQCPVWAYGATEVFSSPILFQELAENFPDVPLIMGHMGFSYEATSAMGVAQRNTNVYMDIAGNMFANVKRVVSRVPIEQILLGTGTPEVGFFDLEIQKVREAVEDPAKQAMILGENAARIFKLGA